MYGRIHGNKLWIDAERTNTQTFHGSTSHYLVLLTFHTKYVENNFLVFDVQLSERNFHSSWYCFCMFFRLILISVFVDNNLKEVTVKKFDIQQADMKFQNIFISVYALFFTNFKLEIFIFILVIILFSNSNHYPIVKYKVISISISLQIYFLFFVLINALFQQQSII